MDDPLNFPEVPRAELERSIGDLVGRAQRVLEVQGRLRSLLRANRVVVEELDLEKVLTHIAEAAVMLGRAEYGILALVRPDGAFERCIHVGSESAAAAAVGHLPIDHSVLAAVASGSGPLRIDDVASDPRAIGFPEHRPPIRSLLAVPVRVRDEAFGTLYLANRADGVFSAEDEDLVTALAATASVAIDNARLYDETRTTQRVSEALESVTATLLDPTSRDDVGVIAEHAATMLAADTAAVLSPPLPGRAVADSLDHPGRGAGLPEALLADADLLARAAAGEHFLIDRDHDTHAALTGPLADSMLLVPMPMPLGTPGVLCVVRAPGRALFRSLDLRALGTFAARAGIVLDLAQTRADRERLDLVEDRSRIARDLHDHAIQRMFGTGLGLRALATGSDAQAAALAPHIAEIEAAISDIRSAIFMLQPDAPREGPRDRLRALLDEIAPTLPSLSKITFSGAIDEVLVGALFDDVAAVLREALANVARHAHATVTSVDVTASHVDIAVSISDDGVGVEPRELASRSSGVTNLAARAEARQGTFSLERSAEGGTRAVWRVPLVVETPAGRTRVFLVDDYEIARRGVGQLIETHPDLVVVGESAMVRGTLERIAAARPDVVLLDVHLPDGNGIDLCRSIRSAHEDIHCVILTAYDDATAGLAAVLAGASGYLSKGVDGARLIEGIRTAGLGQSSMTRRAADGLRASVDDRARRPVVDLTLRERQALRLITEGLTNRQIGERLGIAEKTVKNYVSGLLSKLGMERRTQVAAYGAADRDRRGASGTIASDTVGPHHPG